MNYLSAKGFINETYNDTTKLQLWMLMPLFFKINFRYNNELLYSNLEFLAEM